MLKYPVKNILKNRKGRMNVHKKATFKNEQLKYVQGINILHNKY